MREDVEAEACAHFDRDGFVVVPGLVTPSLCDAFLARNRVFYEDAIFSGLSGHNEDDRFDALLGHAPLLAYARRLLGGPVDCVQTLVFAKPPGARGIALHQEGYYIETEPERLLSAWIALDDADASNGGLAFVRGSHVLGRLPVRAPRDTSEHVEMHEPFVYHARDGRTWTVPLIAGEVVPPEGSVLDTPTVSKGSVVFFDGRTIHGSQRNTDPVRTRHAFSAHFVPRGTWVLRRDLHPPRPV